MSVRREVSLSDLIKTFRFVLKEKGPPMEALPYTRSCGARSKKDTNISIVLIRVFNVLKFYAETRWRDSTS